MRDDPGGNIKATDLIEKIKPAGGKFSTGWFSDGGISPVSDKLLVLSSFKLYDSLLS